MQWSQNLCRICGQISESCHLIYNKDVPSNLEVKIKKCLNLDLCKGDYKPKQICNECVIKLNELSDFIDTSYATNQKFESIYFNSQTWQNRQYECPIAQKQSVIVSNRQVADSLDLELYKNTGIVLENLNVNNYLLNDTEMLELVSNGDYTTENCDTKQKSYYTTTVLRHSAQQETAHLPNYSNCQNVETDKTYIKYDNSYNSNVTHPESSCKSTEINIDGTKQRTVTVYSVQKCITLPSEASTKEKIKKTYACPHCSRFFSRRGSLNSHMAIHTNVRPYKCDECAKAFAIKSDLTSHKKSHNGQHKCSFCPKKFSVPSKLKRHIRIHLNDKPFVCDFPNCDKAFSDKRNLQGHKFVHAPEKKYSCPVCKKLFKTPGRLKQHSKCHSSGLMFTCDLCSKKYKYKSNLISHIKKHNNICPFCKTNCESNTILTNHISLCRARS